MRPLAATLAFLLLATTLAAAETPDLAKLERKIAKEPAYLGKPLYGLLVLGTEAQTKVWLVLDQSKTNGVYDVLYADLNGNGDLSETQERFTGNGEFPLPSLKDPASGITHTDFKVRLSGAGDNQTVMIGMKWRGQLRIGGGYPQDPATGYLRFGDSPEKAPVLWANGDGPFRFQHWISGKLTIGAADHFKVFIGQRGLGANSFFAFQEYSLPSGEGLQATLIYTDAEGKEQTTPVCKLMDKC